MPIKQFPILLLFVFLFAACEDYVPVPKPRTYPRVDYPTKAYQTFDKEYCPFVFEYPVYASIVQDTSFFGAKPAHPCWFDINTPELSASIHVTYNTIDNRKDFDGLVADAFQLSNKHNAKANYMDETRIKDDKRSVYGLLFDISGPVASANQFFVTDSTNHFVLASLYFDTQTRPDSIAPVLQFMREDMVKMVESIEWK